jgi:hypothetical protein
LNPSIVQGRQNSLGNITLSAPAPPGGLIVDLQADKFFAVQIPPFVTVASGQTSALFTVGTVAVSSTQTVTITATAGGVSKTATLLVQ